MPNVVHSLKIEIIVEKIDADRAYRATVRDRVAGTAPDSVGYGPTVESAIGDLLVDLGRDVLGGVIDTLVIPPERPPIEE